MGFIFGRKYRLSRRLIWSAFGLWVKETVTLDFICRKYGISVRSLTERFSIILRRSPDPQGYFLSLLTKEGQRNTLGNFLLIDADWFGKERCLVLYKDAESGKLLLWRFSGGEYWVEILEDLLFLCQNGYLLSGVVSDGRGSIVTATQRLSLALEREIPHQRCLVHVQLSVQRLITQRPKTQAGRELLEITHMLNQIKSESDRKIWTLWLTRWGKRHQELLKEKTYGEAGRWEYTHRFLRRAYRSLIPTDDFFQYLKYPGMPKDTNGIEGVFSQLDGKIQRHRGQSQKKKEALISYLFVFREFPKYSPKTNT